MDESRTPANVRLQILFLAKQLLAGRIGVIATARALSSFHSDAAPEISEILSTFRSIDSESDGLPVGDVRQHWRNDALELKDREIAQIEEYYREDALDAATCLVSLLEMPS
jgi:hypothetical protein